MSVGVVALAAAVVLLAPASLHFGLKGSKRLGQQRHERAGEAGHRRPRTVRRTPAAGLRLGLVRNRVQSARSASRDQAENATSASHTIPVTVAAEQGIVGLAVYVALLVTAFLALFPAPGARRRGSPSRPPSPRWCCTRGPTPDFLEDPFTWTLLGVGVALARPRPDRAGQ